MLIILLTACQKDKDVFVIPVTDNRQEQTLDSIFLYARETYLWNESLPEYSVFNPRKYTQYSETPLFSFEKEIFDITQYAINPATGKSYEYVSAISTHPKYSFLQSDSESGSMRITSSLNTSSLNGTENGFGFALSTWADNDLRIKYVLPYSPAAGKGLIRGDRLLTINETSVSTLSDSEIQQALNQDSITLRIQKANDTLSVMLTKTAYTTSPVIYYSVIQTETKKAGYLVYHQFTDPAHSQSFLDNVFTTFASAQITDLIIDLRYNGGGYVETAEYLLNLIAPSSLTGKIMFSERFNALLQGGKATILSNQSYLDKNNQPVYINGRRATYADVDFTEAGNTYLFQKKGKLENIRSVIFIVSGATASASELVINALRPYLEVKLIGSQTYGKPVGFLGIHIGTYTLYIPNFSNVNAQGDTDYYTGFSPDIAATDDVTHDFGDMKEECLATALSIINGKRTLLRKNLNKPISQREDMNKPENVWKGMIQKRLRLH
ncbi:S41 family peptidase [Xanthocytophaga agilis]|uniref:S41 family peptidase n=1 Tax=Xanthocytophaga agilis TaxID=3048010 RepID=A0AAE3UGR3_9BACT|nr:S41 family peptidase [Xanthocytophaga agilis]MDJ1505243.1 S41 family peptidase [Xanthocytophaga agilis]